MEIFTRKNTSNMERKGSFQFPQKKRQITLNEALVNVQNLFNRNIAYFKNTSFSQN